VTAARPPAAPRAWWSSSEDKGKALNVAATLEIDAVIDPAESRRWLLSILESVKLPGPGGRFNGLW
jgi:acetyl-CoA carboxylase carboxyltransferase component